MMPAMDGVRRGTRTRRLDEAAARASNGASDGDAPVAVLEAVDREAFPDVATRRSIDGGAASAKFRALLDAGGPIVADGAMGTMLFANGLQFGDPPEVWNLAHPDVIRRIQRATSTRARRSCSPTPSAATGRASSSAAMPTRSTS